MANRKSTPFMSLVSIAGSNPTAFKAVSFEQVSLLLGNSCSARSQRAVSRLFSTPFFANGPGVGRVPTRHAKVRAPRFPSGDFQSQPILPA